MSVSDQLASIARILAEVSSATPIEIDGGAVRLHHQRSPIGQLAAAFFGSNTPDWVATTRHYFNGVFGQRRLARMADRTAVDLASPLTRQTVAKLFVAAAEVTLDDLEEAGGPHTQLTPAQLVALRHQLMPFHSIDDALLHDRSGLFDRSYINHGEGHFLDQRVRVTYYDYLQRLPTSSPGWRLCVAKMWCLRPPPEGTILPSSEGLFSVHASIEQHGTGKIFIKALGVRSAAFGSWVCYRGTRRFPPMIIDSWQMLLQSYREDLTLQFGIGGAQATEEKTRALLTDPTLGFVDSPDEQVNLMGFSLGGVHAQRDAGLFPGNVARCVSVSSPGIDRATAAASRHQAAVEHYIEAGDVVHSLGEAHLGGPSVQLHEVRERGQERTPLQPLPCEGSPIAIGRRFVEGMATHNGYTFASPFEVQTWSSQRPDHRDTIEGFLQHSPTYCDARWEGWRQQLATFVP